MAFPASINETADFDLIVDDNIQFESNASSWPCTVQTSSDQYSYSYLNNDSSSGSVVFTADPNNNSYNTTVNYYSFDNATRLDSTNNTPSSVIMDAITTTPTAAPFSPMNSHDGLAEREIIQFWIGVALSVSSSLFIGLSFIIKKKALIRLSKGGRRANQGGYGYLKDLLWWSGLLSMAVGEAANFMAYTFASATLVSTLGVLSVLVTAVLSSKYLHERLNFLGKIGCVLCTIGSTMIVIHAPMEKDIESMEDLEVKLTNFMFVLYVLFTIVFSLVLIYHYRPKLPETSTYTLLIWIGVCSMIGSLSVMSVKGLGLALMRTVTGIQNELTSWLTWFCFVTLIICVSVQMNFLNKALDTFNTAVVTPIYYVFFTSCVIIASAILFNEFAYLPVKDWVGLACGFFTVLTAIVLLHLCKNFDFTLVNLAQQIDLVNDSHQSSGSNIGYHHRHHIHSLHGHEPVKGESLPLPYPKNASTTAEQSTSCGVPVVHDILDLTRGNGNDSSDSEEDELYKSVDSRSNSPRFAMSSKKGGSSALSLSPDSRLLSGSFSSSLGRNRDGYAPLSYGTTDN